MAKMLLALLVLPALLICCDLLGRAAVRFRLPDLLGFLAAGLLFGPTFLNLAGADSPAILPSWTWSTLADIGLAALMVTAGMSISVQLPGSARRYVSLLSAAILICLAPALLSAPLVMNAQFDPTAGASPNAQMAYRGTLSLAVIVTSVPFLARILANKGLLETEFGGTVLSVACIVDLIVWSLFPLLVDLSVGQPSNIVAIVIKPVLTLSFFLIMMTVAVARRHVADRKGYLEDAFRVAYLPLIVGLAFVGVRWLEVGTMLTALAVGIALSGSSGVLLGPAGTYVLRGLRLVFIPLYFALVGASINLHRDFAPLLIVSFLLWSSLIKITMVGLAASALGAGLRGALGYAFALNTRGGPGIALAGLALEANLIGEPTFLALIFASFATAAAAETVLASVKRDVSTPGSGGWPQSKCSTI